MDLDPKIPISTFSTLILPPRGVPVTCSTNMPNTTHPTPIGPSITKQKSILESLPRRDYSYLLHLPTSRVIEDSFKIVVEQDSIVSPNIIRITNFCISTTYLVKPESINFTFTNYDYYLEQKIISLNRYLLSYINQIEYLLSIPLDDLALHLNEDNEDLKRLVYWRYSLPTPSLYRCGRYNI